MEAPPLFKGRNGSIIVLLGPLQHVWREIYANPVAVFTNHRLGLVQHIIGVDNNNALLGDDARLDQVVKQAAQLDVAGLVGHELVEARQLDQWRQRAPVV